MVLCSDFRRKTMLTTSQYFSYSSVVQYRAKNISASQTEGGERVQRKLGTGKGWNQDNRPKLAKEIFHIIYDYVKIMKLWRVGWGNQPLLRVCLGIDQTVVSNFTMYIYMIIMNNYHYYYFFSSFSVWVNSFYLRLWVLLCVFNSVPHPSGRENSEWMSV